MAEACHLASSGAEIETERVAIPPDLHWYAVQTRPKQEQRTAANLRSSLLTTLLPMVRLPRRNGRIATAPLFPCYLFVQCDISRWAQRIRYTRGVAKMLGTRDGPSAIDDTILGCIQERIGSDGFVELIDPMSIGDPVEIMSGPLKGLIGVFHSTTSAAERVVLLLNAANGQMRALVNADEVRKVTA